LAADLDGDEDLDIVALSALEGPDPAPRHMLLINVGAGRFLDVSDERLPSGAFAASGLAAADVEADGDLDLLVTSSGAPCRLWLGDGLGAFMRAGPDALPDEVVPGATSPAMADINGDGAVDLFVPASGQDRVYFGDGNGRFFDVTSTALGSESDVGLAAAIADLDRDGHGDVVVLARQAPVRIYRNDGAGRLFDYSGQIGPNPAGLPQAGLALGDVDADGDDDLFISRAEWAPPALLVSWDPEPADDGDLDGVVDEADNCPDLPNADQANRDRHHFICASTADCSDETGCELAVIGQAAYLMCSEAALSWSEAQSFCLGRDASLATVQSAQQGEDLAGLGLEGYWLGYTDAQTEGQWQTAEGESASYTSWAADEPKDETGSEDCVAMNADGDWVAVDCAGSRPFVCRDLRAKNPDPGDGCDRCPDRNDPGDTPIDPDSDAGAPDCDSMDAGTDGGMDGGSDGGR